MLEVETLGPLTQLAPGAAVEHVEDWYLVAGVKSPTNDAEVGKFILPKLRGL